MCKILKNFLHFIGRPNRKLVLRMLRASAVALILQPISGHTQIVEESIPGDPIATESGRIAGKLLPSGVKAYFGVPFAAAPVQENRWREPQPVKTWRGVYNADRHAPECIQVLRRHDINHYFGEEATSEDCLYLNIWAPGQALTDSKMPVVVWIYGGGLTIGSASMANYNGENLARKGVVYVSIAYRVGALGFLAHPELTAESANASSGNYGYLDQVAALEWIQQNIEAFGGDPERVLIMGQSAGSGSAFNLQASPLARGLFHRIVGMSGGGLAFGEDPVPLDEAEKAGLALQEAMKVDSIAALRNIPADRILAAQSEFQVGSASTGSLRFRPNVDGYFMAATPRDVFAAGEQNDVPLLLGFTRDEDSNDLSAATSIDEYVAAAMNYYGERAEEFLQLYPASDVAEMRRNGKDAARDGGRATLMRSWALAQTATGHSAVFMYTYAHKHPYVPGVRIADQNIETIGAYHTSEVPYFLQTFDVYNRFRPTRHWTEYDLDLSNKMSNVIVAFAGTGNPSTDTLAMPEYSADSELLMEFGDGIRIIDFDSDKMNFMATVPRARRTRTLQIAVTRD